MMSSEVCGGRDVLRQEVFIIFQCPFVDLIADMEYMGCCIHLRNGNSRLRGVE